MKLLNWLLRSKRHAPPAPVALQLAPGRGFTFRLTGEMQHQDALDEICGGKCEAGHRLPVTAELRFEVDNPYDADAIAVWVAGERVGYVPAGIARRLRAAIERLNPDGLSVTCDAKIVGGWKREGGEEGHYGVNLSLSDPLRVAKPEAGRSGRVSKPSEATRRRH